MDKWEYLRVKEGDDLVFAPPSKVDISWVLKKYPKTHLEEKGREFQTTIKMHYPEWYIVKYDIWDFLGNQGWEAFMMLDGWICFKRRLVD